MRFRHSFVALAFLALGCASSASETPWPAEPEGKLLGPAGELARDDDGRPKALTDDAGAPNVEP